MNPKFIFITLCLLFFAYSLSIYLKPFSIKDNVRFNKVKAAEGRIVWQEYNCQSCHQLYGLGGYLGPDLTNIISNPNKGEKLIRIIVKSGVKQMPAFKMNENELIALIEFLKSVDASGVSDPRKFNITNDGMIE